MFPVERYNRQGMLCVPGISFIKECAMGAFSCL